MRLFTGIFRVASMRLYNWSKPGETGMLVSVRVMIRVV
jgi:hypothetical protein